MNGASSRIASLPVSMISGDSSLVERVLTRGDRWAEEALYRRHVNRVATLAARLLRHGPDVEDVVQDTFVDAFRDLSKLRRPELFGHWLLRIAVRKVHRRFRRRRLRRLLGLEQSLDNERLVIQARMDAPQEALATISQLDTLLDEMAPVDRICWLLLHLEGYELSGVTQLVGCSLATARRRVARAQSRLKGQLDAPSHA